MLLDTISFLQNSQTFLGVLITLNILCIFANKDEDGAIVPKGVNSKNINDSNFILRFIHQFKVKFEEELKQLENSIAEVRKEFESSKDYTTLKRLLSKSDGLSSESLKKANSIDVRCSRTLADLNTLVSYGYVKMNSIEASNEVNRAPLFTLLFGLIFFVIDEICNRWQNGIYDNLIIFSVFFISLSSAYWIVLWIFLFCRRNYQTYTDLHKTRRWFEKINYIDGGVLKIIICITIFYLGILFIPIQEITYDLSWIIILALAVVPIATVGALREYYCRVKGNYSFMHTTGHLIAFAVYSVALTYVFYKLNLEGLVFTESEIIIGNIRFSIIVFSLLNGLLFPFMIPYLKLKYISFSEMSKLSNGRKNLEKLQKTLSSDLGDICKEIVADSTSASES